MEREDRLSGYEIPPIDFIRFIIISAFTLVGITITIYSFSGNLGTLYAQIFYIPIIYATWFYPKKGLVLACGCAVVYEFFAYFYIYPDTGGMILVTGEALLFVCVSALIMYYREKDTVVEVYDQSIIDKSPMGVILFDKNDYTIRLNNTRIEHMLGYPSEDLAKMTLPDLLSSPEEKERFAQAVASGEEISSFETVFMTREKEPVWVNLAWNRITENLMSCTVEDINKFRLARMAADKIDAQYRQVTDSLPTCIVIIRDNMIVYANPPFEVFSGYTQEELQGKDPMSLIHPDDQSDFMRFLHLAETGSPLPLKSEVNFLVKSGKMRPAILFFTRILQNGSPSVLLNLVDISEQDRIKGRTHQEKRQRGIISTFAYELRTPLQPIMGYLNLLMQDPETYGVTEETRVILDRCAKSVDRERQIINQMLELSDIDTGKISLEYSLFSVPDLLKTIIDNGGYAKDAEITMDVPGDLTFDADKSRISTVVDTMLSNAVKYSTHPRKIHIAYRSSQNDTMHRLSIRDNGIGITDARLDEIFEPFPIPDSGDKNLKFEKIGLSLAIAKKYIKMHGGYISVDSIINLETTFCIHIPKKRPGEVEYNGT